MKKEEEIFELLKTNRKLGIEELYKNYSKLVFGVIYSILKNTDETEDVLQNVFIKIFKLDNEKLPTKSDKKLKIVLRIIRYKVGE